MASKGGMRIRDFLVLLPPLVLDALPSRLKDFKTVGPTFSLMKFHYGRPSIHYEVWVQRRWGRVELGLHFEADAETNSRYLEGLSDYFAEIQAGLGPDVEPEQWTESWTRLHQTISLKALDEVFASEIAGRIAQMMAVLQPMVEEVDGQAT